MPSYNKVMIMGNVTRDIELRYTPKQTAVADLGIACNRTRTGEDGRRIEEVTFVDVTLWGRTAELASQYLSKGRPVFIEGRLQMDTWTDQQTGKQRSKLKIVGENMQFIGSQSGEKAPSSQAQQNGSTVAQNATDQPPAKPDPMDNNLDDDNDIPF